MKKNKKIATLCLMAALATATVGGAYSYFTNATETKVNNFTIANGGNEEDKGTIIEEGWDAIKDGDTVQNIMPGATITKDPKFQSTANYPTYVYAEVTIPAVKSSAGDTIKINGEVAEAKTPYMTLGGIGENWTLLGTDTDSTDGKILYVYGYNQALDPSGTTEEIFTNFQVADFSKFPEGESAQQIDVKVRTVQTEGQTSPTLENYKTLFGDNANLK